MGADIVYLGGYPSCTAFTSRRSITPLASILTGALKYKRFQDVWTRSNSCPEAKDTCTNPVLRGSNDHRYWFQHRAWPRSRNPLRSSRRCKSLANAGVLKNTFDSAEGTEITITVNVIGTFLLILNLLPLLRKSKQTMGMTPRVTITSSILH